MSNVVSNLLSFLCHAPMPAMSVKGIENDSRRIQPGDLFLAYPGTTVDGRQFVQDALKNGASAIAYDPSNAPSALSALPMAFPVHQLSDHLSTIASRFYAFPTRSLIVTGVTGTNGKTTIAYQLAQAHALLNQTARYIGTLGEGVINALTPLLNTTPDGLQLQKILARYRDERVKHVAMEVSSHALSLHRVNDIYFNQAIFTNLSHDHLDFHHTLEAYAEAKSQLFANPSLKAAIINQDDDYKTVMQAKIPEGCSRFGYSLNQSADVMAKRYTITMTGSVLEVVSPWGPVTLQLQALGLFNIYNGLAVFTSLMAHGYPLSEVVSIMPQLKASPGRMEVVATNPLVLVDYAHTPDALDNVLKTLAPLKKGKMIVVFGCGGDRDKTKRPMMAAVASQWADEIIITSDNPRSENPAHILDDIEVGIVNKSRCQRIEDRKSAILKGLSLCNKEDILVIAGKGHENYQQIGLVKFPFSDQMVIQEAIQVSIA